MNVTELYPEDLVFEHEAAEATGVPGTVIRQWARRGKIRRFTGRPGEYSGQGHEFKTMYALPEIQERAVAYRPMPQRAPKAA
jgi:predicted site-specific integrase-resolvase